MYSWFLLFYTWAFSGHIFFHFNFHVWPVEPFSRQAQHSLCTHMSLFPWRCSSASFMYLLDKISCFLSLVLRYRSPPSRCSWFHSYISFLLVPVKPPLISSVTVNTILLSLSNLRDYRIFFLGLNQFIWSYCRQPGGRLTWFILPSRHIQPSHAACIAPAGSSSMHSDAYTSMSRGR